jgi:hypothetical protein
MRQSGSRIVSCETTFPPSHPPYSCDICCRVHAEHDVNRTRRRPRRTPWRGASIALSTSKLSSSSCADSDPPANNAPEASNLCRQQERMSPRNNERGWGACTSTATWRPSLRPDTHEARVPPPVAAHPVSPLDIFAGDSTRPRTVLGHLVRGKNRRRGQFFVPKKYGERTVNNSATVTETRTN